MIIKTMMQLYLTAGRELKLMSVVLIESYDLPAIKFEINFN